jgi:L-amino acid N-acyltransferase YncA
MKPFLIRDSQAGDVPTITAIYAHWVTHGLASFEIEPPEDSEMARRRDAVLAAGFPFLVAEAPEGVLGYAYASAYRSRPAYRFSVEKSVYVAPGAGRRGVGLTLMEEVIARCTAAGFRQMIAVIGDSGNAASIALHRRAGFSPAGILKAAGWKHGRWVDSVLMQRPLGDGSAKPPETI